MSNFDMDRRLFHQFSLNKHSIQCKLQTDGAPHPSSLRGEASEARDALVRWMPEEFRYVLSCFVGVSGSQSSRSNFKVKEQCVSACQRIDVEASHGSNDRRSRTHVERRLRLAEGTCHPERSRSPVSKRSWYGS